MVHSVAAVEESDLVSGCSTLSRIRNEADGQSGYAFGILPCGVQGSKAEASPTILPKLPRGKSEEIKTRIATNSHLHSGLSHQRL